MNQTQLQIVISAINNAQQQLNDAAQGLSGLGTTADNSSKSMGQMFQDMSNAAKTAAIDLLPISAAFDLIEGDLVKQASSAQTATDQGNVLIESVSKNGSTSSATATQIAFLTDKINGYKATIAKADASIAKQNTTTEAGRASIEKSQASIATAQSNIGKYQQQLDLLTNSQQNTTQSASDVESQFQALADTNTNLGISYEDSYTSLSKFYAQTGNTKDALAAYNAAIDLHLVKGVDMTTATNAVTQAMNGMGKGVQDMGVHIKDGLSGMASVSGITDVIGDAADKMKDSLGVQLSGALENTNKVAATLGSSQLPILTLILQAYSNLANGANDWLKAHQTAAGGISAVSLTLSSSFTALETGLTGIATAGLAVTGFQKLFIGDASVMAGALDLIAAGWAALNFGMILAAAPWILLIALIALFAYVVNTQTQNIITGFQVLWQGITTMFDKGRAYFQQFWSDVTTGFQVMVSSIESIVTGFIKNIQSGFAVVTSLISSIRSAAGSVGSTVSSVGSSMLNMVPHFASGGIVTSPTMALVGEAGPEAIIPLSAFNGGSGLARGGGGGSAGGITVNVLGGTYLDSNGATMIANAIGKQVVRQLRVSNFN
jgi:hypothetical protein